ncbi:MAG: hypothetical protein ACLQG3_05020 [Terracidiphilus sp.]
MDRGIFFFEVAVKLSQFLADFVGSDAHYRVVAGIVADRASEHLRADHAFPKAVYFTIQGMPDDQAKEILRAFSARKRMARQDFLEVLAHERFLFRT